MVPSLSDIRRRLGEDPRLTGIFKGGLSGIASKGMVVLVNAVTLPLTIRYLGPFQYGIWVTISTSVVMFAVLDLGIANTLTNFISRAYAQNDEPMARRYFATALWLTTGISAVLALLGLSLWKWIDWGALFHVQDPYLATQTATCAAVCFGFFVVGLPLNLVNKVLSGYQQVHLANYFLMLNSLLGLIAIVSVVLMHGTIVQLMLFFCAANLTGTFLLNLWLYLWHKPGLRPDPQFVTPSMIRDLFTEGLLFFVLQLAGLVAFNTDNLVISHYLGASEVTPYSVAWRLAGYASIVQSMLAPSLWPAFAEAYHRRDMPWIRKTYRRLMRISILVVGSLAVGIGLFGRTAIRIWAGPSAVPGSLLLWSMAVWAIIFTITVNQALLMAATQRIQLQAVTSTLSVIFNLALSIFWVQRIGALGVIGATIVSYLIFIVVPQAWQVHRILEGRYLERVRA